MATNTTAVSAVVCKICGDRLRVCDGCTINYHIFDEGDDIECDEESGEHYCEACSKEKEEDVHGTD